MSRTYPTDQDWLLDMGEELWQNIPHRDSAYIVNMLEAFGAEHPYELWLINARFWERLSYRQLARKMGKKHPGSSWWAVQQALKRLREFMEVEYAYNPE